MGKKRSSKRRNIKWNKAKGGKYIGKGAYGCVYSPSLEYSGPEEAQVSELNSVVNKHSNNVFDDDIKCNSIGKNSSEVSKIMPFKDAIEELSHVPKYTKIGRWKEFFIIPKIELCFIKPTNEQHTDDGRNNFLNCSVMMQNGFMRSLPITDAYGNRQNLFNYRDLQILKEDSIGTPSRRAMKSLNKYVALTMMKADGTIGDSIEPKDNMNSNFAAALLQAPNGTINPKEVLKSFEKLFEAIYEMGEKKIIHQDLKDANIYYKYFVQSKKIEFYIADIGLTINYDDAFKDAYGANTDAGVGVNIGPYFPWPWDWTLLNNITNTLRTRPQPIPMLHRLKNLITAYAYNGVNKYGVLYKVKDGYPVQGAGPFARNNESQIKYRWSGTPMNLNIYTLSLGAEYQLHPSQNVSFDRIAYRWLVQRHFTEDYFPNTLKWVKEKFGNVLYPNNVSKMYFRSWGLIPPSIQEEIKMGQTIIEQEMNKDIDPDSPYQHSNIGFSEAQIINFYHILLNCIVPTSELKEWFADLEYIQKTHGEAILPEFYKYSMQKIDLWSISKELTQLIVKRQQILWMQKGYVVKDIKTNKEYDEEYHSELGQFYRLMFIFTNTGIRKRPTPKLALSMFRKYINGDFNAAIIEYNKFLNEMKIKPSTDFSPWRSHESSRVSIPLSHIRRNPITSMTRVQPPSRLRLPIKTKFSGITPMPTSIAQPLSGVHRDTLRPMTKLSGMPSIAPIHINLETYKIELDRKINSGAITKMEYDRLLTNAKQQNRSLELKRAIVKSAIATLDKSIQQPKGGGHRKNKRKHYKRSGKKQKL